MIETLATNAAVLGVALVALWGLSLVLRDASIADPAWGAGFVLLAWLSALGRGDPPGSVPMDWCRAVLLAMVTLWGARLAGHLVWRKLREPVEDPRYAAMRRHWGPRFWWVSLGTVFLLQGALLWGVALPVQWALAGGPAGPPGVAWTAAGVALWAVGLFFEAVGDWQLARFRADPANHGRVLETGLWRYTRHPNYFGDACVWWGLWCFSRGLGAPWWTALSPLAMTTLLVAVSGVRLTEQTITSRRPGYAAYQRRTSPFIPWPPREGP